MCLGENLGLWGLCRAVGLSRRALLPLPCPECPGKVAAPLEEVVPRGRGASRRWVQRPSVLPAGIATETHCLRVLMGKSRRPFSQTSASPCPRLVLGFHGEVKASVGGRGHAEGQLCLHTARWALLPRVRVSGAQVARRAAPLLTGG